MESLVQPVARKERIQSLDILRGIAILGILLMNIQSFTMPGAAYLNPFAFGDLEGLNYWVYVLGNIFADQKFITIFSILFGAGIVLVTEKAEKKTGTSTGLHYKRNFWLLIIGLLHAHLIWYGDILVAYSIGGFVVYFLPKNETKNTVYNWLSRLFGAFGTLSFYRSFASFLARGSCSGNNGNLATKR